MPLLRARSEPGWLAFVPQGERLRVVQVLPDGEGQRLSWTWEGSWKPAERSATLHALRKEHAARCHAIWLLERGQYQLMTTEAPSDLPREEWRDALRWQLKDQVSDFDVADAAVDLLSVPGNPQRAQRGEQLLAVLTPRAPLRPLVGLLEQHRFRLHAIDIPETALRNLSGRCEPPGRAQALLSFGGGSGQLVITHGGELLMSRQIDVAAELLSSEDDARRDAAIDRSSLEVQRTLDSFERVHSHLSLARLLSVPGPGMAALGEHMKMFVNVPVQPFDLAAVLDTQQVPALQGAGAAPWLLALGAALRDPV